MDGLTFAKSGSLGIRFFWCDVTVTTRALEARHLCGPAATQVLGEALACAALFSADLTRPEEVISIQVLADGPIRGVVAEATQTGDLRGFTHAKVLESFDTLAVQSTAALMGATGQAVVMRSVPGHILGRSVVPATPPDLRTIAARYLNNAVQTPAGVQLPVGVDTGGIIGAGGLSAELMPDGNRTAFFDLLERMLRRPAPLPGKGLDRDGIAALLEVPDLEVLNCRPMRFKCRCSTERIQDMLAMLPPDELKALAEGPPQRRVTCHMCGADYAIEASEARRLLAERQAAPQ